MATQVSGAAVGRSDNPDELHAVAQDLRATALRMIAQAGSGHPGGSLSAADIVATLFFHEMRHDPTRPDWPERDRFILSKGHGVPILYAALARAGYIEESLLGTLRKLGSPLQGHPSVRDLPAVEASTGSLGQGLSVGVGEALAGRLDRADYRVYVVLGDGECDEGQVWEAALSAAHHHLDNLIAIVDANGFQLDGSTESVLDLSPLREKWASFGWQTIEVDGHSVPSLLPALATPRPRWQADGAARPHAIIARTVKGKGVSFMENNNDFHGRAPTPDELQQALAELHAEGGSAPSHGAPAPSEGGNRP